MRLGDEPESNNFEDRTGQSGGLGFGGGGGSALGCLLPLVASRFGIGGIIVLIIGYFILSSLGGLGGGGGVMPGTGTQQALPAGQSTLSPEMRSFLVHVLGSTEQTWGEIFAKCGARYEPTTLVAYTQGTRTACGYGQAAAGPFYCPNDSRIYVDSGFLQRTVEEVRRARRRGGSLRHRARSRASCAGPAGHPQQGEPAPGAGEHDRGKCNPGEDRAPGGLLCRGMGRQRARCARGRSSKQAMRRKRFAPPKRSATTRCRSRAQGYVVPDSFTHGSSAQRTAAFQKGLQCGDPKACAF